MKKFLYAIVALFFFSFAAEAQVPQSVCYQAENPSKNTSSTGLGKQPSGFVLRFVG